VRTIHISGRFGRGKQPWTSNATNRGQTWYRSWQTCEVKSPYQVAILLSKSRAPTQFTNKSLPNKVIVTYNPWTFYPYPWSHLKWPQSFSIHSKCRFTFLIQNFAIISATNSISPIILSRLSPYAPHQNRTGFPCMRNHNRCMGNFMYLNHLRMPSSHLRQNALEPWSIISKFKNLLSASQEFAIFVIIVEYHQVCFECSTSQFLVFLL